MSNLPPNRSRGLTLVELSVAIGIMSVMFISIAFLVILMARNTVLVSQQALSQNQAAAAAERITNTIRNASGIRAYGTDDTNTTLTRILFDIPETGKSGAVAFVEPSAEHEADGVVKIFLDSTKYKPGSVKTDKADYEFRGIEKFGILYRSPTWLTMTIFYSYKSYMNFASHDNDNDKKLAGEFITDVIAKNHHPGEGGNYAETTSSIFLL